MGIRLRGGDNSAAAGFQFPLSTSMPKITPISRDRTSVASAPGIPAFKPTASAPPTFKPSVAAIGRDIVTEVFGNFAVGEMQANQFLATLQGFELGQLAASQSASTDSQQTSQGTVSKAPVQSTATQPTKFVTDENQGDGNVQQVLLDFIKDKLSQVEFSSQPAGGRASPAPTQLPASGANQSSTEQSAAKQSGQSLFDKLLPSMTGEELARMIFGNDIVDQFNEAEAAGLNVFDILMRIEPSEKGKFERETKSSANVSDSKRLRERAGKQRD